MNELAKYIDDYIYHNRIKKVDIASALGISRQRVNQILDKKQFGIDDANYILSAINCKIDYKIKPITEE